MTRASPLAAVSVLLLAASSCLQGQVLINEIMASNQSGLTDEDGETSDWIELYNAGLQTVDLAGYHLTDEPTAPLKWTFPSYLLAPGSYLVVFASGKDRAVAQMHTSFSLLATGEYLELTDPSGATVHVAGDPFPAQSADVSYGLLQPGDTALFGYFQTPSPGAANITGTALLPPPFFSETSRTFVAPLNIVLTPPVSGYQMRYTVDGTQPTATSALYTGPILLVQTTRLRARLFSGSQVAGQLGGATYVHLANGADTFTSNLPLMILENFSGGRPTNGTLAEWMLFEPNSASQRTSLLGAPALRSRSLIKVRGSSTANDPKYSLGLETRNEQDEDSRVSPFSLPSDSDWVLQAPYSFDRALIRNALAYQLSRDMGRYASRTRQVELFLNTDGGSLTAADYFGVFTFMEKVTRGEDRVDIEKLRTTDYAVPEIEGGYLFKIDRPDPGDVGFTASNGQKFYFVDPKEQEVTVAQRTWITGHVNGLWSALIGAAPSDPDTGYPAHVDLNPSVDHHLLNVAVKNLDALRLSTYLYKDRWGKLTWGPVWDFDRSMESTDGRDDNFNTWRGETGDQGTDYFRYPIWNELFRDGNFWQRWIDRYGTARSGALATSRVHALIDSMTSELTEAQVRNFAKWPTVTPRTSWAWEVQHLKDWLASRFSWIDDQFTKPPVANTPHPNGGLVPAGFQLVLTSPSLVKPGAKIYYTLDGTDPRPAETDSFDLSLVPLNAPVKAYLPAFDIGTAWRGSSTAPDPFNDTGWINGTNGMGYDDTVDYDAYIGVNFEAPNPVMKNIVSSAYLRAKFTLSPAQVVAISRMELRMRYDDGFVAFLNGVQIASGNPPTSLAWNALASAGRADSDAIVPAPFNVSPFISALHPGENVLAIHGLNNPINSTDFLCQAELVASTAPRVTASAIEYTGSIGIGGVTNLKARVYDPAGPYTPYPYTGAGSGLTPVGSHWSAPLPLTLFTDAVAASAGNLVISEMMYNPSPPTATEAAAGWDADDFSYIVLTNIGTAPVNLAGIYFSAGIHFEAPLTTLSYLPAGGSVVVVARIAAFAARYPGCLAPVLGDYQENLSTTGEQLTLRDAGGAIIKDFSYSDQPPWPQQADGLGHSLVLRNPAANPPHGIPQNWRSSLDFGGELPGTLPATFAAWRLRHFNSTAPNYALLSAASADPDGDGADNFLEFALATDPNAENSTSLRFERQGGNLLIKYERRPGLSGVQFQILTSSGNNSWQAAGVPVGAPVRHADGGETVTVQPAETSAGRKFYRLQVSQP